MSLTVCSPEPVMSSSHPSLPQSRAESNQVQNRSRPESNQVQNLATPCIEHISPPQSLANEISAKNAVTPSKQHSVKKLSHDEKQKYPIKCTYCEEKFVHQSSLSRHINRKHKESGEGHNIDCTQYPAL